MEEKTVSSLIRMGYLYHYPKIEHPTDKFRLDIYLSENPLEQLFRTKNVKLPVLDKEGVISHLTITHPWHFEKQAVVCPGLVILEDQTGNKEEAYSLGGSLDIDQQESYTICSLVSNAPIIDITLANPMRRLLFEELEITLAGHGATFVDHNEFETRLCQADPLTLYLACLEALTEKFEHFPQMDDQYILFLAYLHAQEHRLREAGLLKHPAPSLNDTL